MRYRSIYFVVLIAVFLALAVGLTGRLVAAEVDIVADIMTEADSYGGVTFAEGADGSITVTFAEQSASGPPALSAGTVVADVGISSDTFVGDYIAAGVKGLRFSIVSDGHRPSSAMLVLKNQDGRTWCNRNVVVSEEAGKVVVNNVLFERSAGWDRNERSTVDKDAMWLADLLNVGMIGIRLTQAGIEEQSYTVSKFMLVDVDGMISVGSLMPLQDALLIAFGVSTVGAVSQEQAGYDTDGDGMTDLTEIRSENDEGYANSIFIAEMLKPDKNGTTIQWACVKDAEYIVLRSTDLNQGFTLLDGSTWTKADETGFMTYTDATAVDGKSYFYMIRKKVPVSTED
ncbi:MAG: hypothetical protein KAH23_06480 [Kiritimatiellae bacterium]|nr:hypothetical protein [Kiritimatiellia bacterium]